MSSKTTGLRSSRRFGSWLIKGVTALATKRWSVVFDQAVQPEQVAEREYLAEVAAECRR